MSLKGGNPVEMKREPVIIPTYVPHAADKNPMFYEKRAYQGASGKTYPLPVTDRLSHEITNKSYDSVTLENEYIKIMVLPEIGGRIHVGLDKTNRYNFIYHNTVIKPALIGIAGPWISGGIEFNWPQHHRPTTFMPLETVLEENPDGSRTVWVGEVEPLYRTKSMAGVTVYPGRSYLKVKVRAYNRTPYPQQFMWWANLGVHVDENYRIFFPPDVRSVAFHDRAFTTEWPMLKGRYADLDFKDGLDGTWFKNHYAAGSFMVMDGSTDFNFVEGYDMAKHAGVIHVGDRHVSPGKKLFTWGNGEFAKAWMENLTDRDGHYIELMTGMYTDNQPDFSWMMPNETRVFEHCWYPVREIGEVKNATEDAAVSLKVEGGEIRLGYHVTGRFEGCMIVLRAGDRLILEQKAALDPATPYTTSVNMPGGLEEHQLWTAIYTAGGRELVSFRPLKPEAAKVPEPRKPSPQPKDIKENEELYIHGLHIEQYRHHSLEAEDYYQEALSRDPGDIRCNNAMGLICLKAGRFEEAEKYFLKAKERLTSRNTNPYDGEPIYNLGLARKFLGKYEEAYKDFYKAAWNYTWKSAAYHSLAGLDCRKGDFEKALYHIDQSLATNMESIRSRDLKAAVLRRLGRLEEAWELTRRTLKIDALDYWARFEQSFACAQAGNQEEASRILDEIWKVTLGKPELYIDTALEYSGSGMAEEAMAVLRSYVDKSGEPKVFPMIYYHMGLICASKGEEEKAAGYFRKGEQMSTDYCFPSRLESIEALRTAQKLNPEGAKAWYYLGNLYYDKKRADDAIECWEKSAALDDGFAIVLRNLAIAYFEKRKDAGRAKKMMEKAFARNRKDSRLLYELLQLYKNSNDVSVEDRLNLLKGHEDLIAERNDLYLEKIILLLQKGELEEAAKEIGNHVYDVYEGGEGKLVKVHEWIYILKGLKAAEAGDYEAARKDFGIAMVLPDYYHEGRHNVSSVNHINYFAGLTAEQAGMKEAAAEYFEAASKPPVWVGEGSFYQGLACRKLGREDEAAAIFNSLIGAGNAMTAKGGRYDFFATGVPTPPPFENDREKRNMSEGLYMKALGLLGQGRREQASEELEKVLEWNANHLGAWIHSGKSGKLPL